MGAVDQYFLGNEGMAERFGSAEDLVFRRDISQAAFLVMEAGLGTVFPEDGRHLTVSCMCSEKKISPGKGALTSLQNYSHLSKESHRVMRPGHHILCHLLVCPLRKYPGLEVCLGQWLSL